MGATVKPIVITNETDVGLLLRQLMGDNILLSLGDPLPTDWGGVIFSFVNLGFLGLLWFLSWRIKYRDFNLWFMICQLIPLSLFQFFQFILDLNYRANFLGSSHKWHIFAPDQTFFHRLFLFLFIFLQKTVYRNIILGTGLLLITCIIVAKHRVGITKQRCYCFCVILIISAAFGFIQSIFLLLEVTVVDFIFSFLDRGFTVFHSIAYIVAICAVCCCSFARHGMAPDPYVANARSRMGWTWLFVSFGFTFFIYAEAAAQVNSSKVDIDQMIKGYKRYQSNKVDNALLLTVELVYAILYFLPYLAPIVLLISAILFYPSYRSACFGTQGYDSNLWAHSAPPVPHTGIQMKTGAPTTDGYQDTVVMAPAPTYSSVPPAPMIYQNPDGSYQMLQYCMDMSQYQQQPEMYQYQQNIQYNQQQGYGYNQQQQPMYYTPEQYRTIGTVPQYG